MSGIYIPDMEMPTSCAECRFYGEYCYAKGDENKYSNFPCPLVPVPEHGRLIDADAIPYKKIMLEDDDFYYGVTMPYIDRMPTIIPADPAKEEQT